MTSRNSTGSQKKRIIIVAGGTGGHVFPALCIAERLKLWGHDVVFATDSRGDSYLGSYAGRKCVQKINNSSRLRLIISLTTNLLLSIFFLARNRVDGVVGFGGYPSLPFVLAAQLLRIKTVLHEQNAIVGRANKLLSIMASKVIVSFQSTANLQLKKNILIGNPTRFEHNYMKPPLKRTHRAFTILIFGGSQGARIFSEVVCSAICEIAKIERLRVWHQGRQTDLPRIIAQYSASDLEYSTSSFFVDIANLYEESDLVISRAGASSIFEIIGFKKPSILIPFQMSVNGDQKANAEFLRERGAAIVIEENEPDLQKKLTESILKIMHNAELRLQISRNLQKLYEEDVTEKCARLIENELAGAPGFEPGK
ncbi:MAG: UDP-N-acetylglucosamine--N-acetylmuramyl-(pentapeptide) pyrophosphoryl-undecaprenol N-acetylglucosamine transferase [Holosporales bacterium]|nr:UDP-N-acetylglucosamine--N-acetylmuramyl-(pentapeptide) pyrophosphoryl-undecaprenol N-acetylglucosamine transferase [Holosporales bacterium]